METWRHGDTIDMETWKHGEIEKWRRGHGHEEMETTKRKTEAEAIFLNPFTVCSSCKHLSVC